MIPPCSLVHSQAWSRNSSRLRSLFLIPFLRNLCTTFASVAIDAWSVPGTQHALYPFIRARRTRTSWIVLFSIWPICRTPVTLGGVMTTERDTPESGSERKQVSVSEYAYHSY